MIQIVGGVLGSCVCGYVMPMSISVLSFILYYIVILIAVEYLGL